MGNDYSLGPSATICAAGAPFSTIIDAAPPIGRAVVFLQVNAEQTRCDLVSLILNATTVRGERTSRCVIVRRERRERPMLHGRAGGMF
jgi:hypothetical protein